MEINFHRLQYFISVAETLNFTKAAQDLYVSPQALNQQIIKLEEELGCSLFLRSTRSVHLTEAGEYLYTKFAPIIKQFDDGCVEFEKWQKRKNHILKIGYLEAISREDVIKPVVQYLHKLDEDIQVQIQAGQLNEVSKWMKEGSVDLCITNVHEYEIWCEDFEKIQVLQMPAVLVTAKDHPWAKKNVISPEDMKQFPILLMKQPKDMEKDSFYSKIKGSENVYYPNYDSILMNMETGPYYSVFPKQFDNAHQRGKLRCYDLPEEYRFSFCMYIMFHPENRFASVLRKIKVGKDELEITT